MYLQIHDENDLLKESFSLLYQQNIQSIIIEGGSTLLNALIEKNLWDEARIFYSKQSFEDGINAPILRTTQISNDLAIEEDLLKIYFNR